MAAGTTIKLKRKADAFVGGELATGEFGLDTKNVDFYGSIDGTTVFVVNGSRNGAGLRYELTNIGTGSSDPGSGNATTGVTDILYLDDEDADGYDISNLMGLMPVGSIGRIITPATGQVTGVATFTVSSAPNDLTGYWAIETGGGMDGTGTLDLGSCIIEFVPKGLYDGGPIGTPSAIDLTNATGLPEGQVTAHEAALTLTAGQVDTAGAVMNSDTSTAPMGFFVDEDDMSSDSATKGASQQSIKAYTDSFGAGGFTTLSAQIDGAGDLDIGTSRFLNIGANTGVVDTVESISHTSGRPNPFYARPATGDTITWQNNAEILCATGADIVADDPTKVVVIFIDTMADTYTVCQLWDDGGGGGGGLTSTALKTTDYTAVANDRVLVSTESANVDITLPASPTVDDTVEVVCAKDHVSNTITVSPDTTDKINSANEDWDGRLVDEGDRVIFIWIDEDVGWVASFIPAVEGVTLTFTPDTQTYATPGEYTYTVPTGATELEVKLWGAAGRSYGHTLAEGGPGGYTTAIFPILPETTIDPDRSMVVVHLNGDGTDESQVVLDYSRHNHTVSVGGNAKIDSAQYKFNGSSIYFDGTTDYLSVAGDPVLDLQGDHTIQFWFRPSSVTGVQTIWGSYDGTYHQYAIKLDGTTLKGYARSGVFTGYDLLDGETLATGIAVDTWYHVEISRKRGIWRSFLDGVKVLDTGTDDSLWANVVLQLRMQGADASTEFVDDSGHHIITALNQAQVDTDIAHNTNSLLLDGVNDYLNIPSSSWLDFGTDDYCFEAWVYPVTGADDQSGILGRRAATLATGQWNLIFRTSNPHVQFQLKDATTLTSSDDSVPYDTWTHIAVSREGADTRLWINGVEDTAVNEAAETLDNTKDMTIGTRYTTTTDFQGNIEDVRLTRGNARYTTTFTPPASLPALTNRGNSDIGTDLMYWGSKDGTTEEFTGWIDEFIIWDGVAKHTGNFTVPTEEYPHSYALREGDTLTIIVGNNYDGSGTDIDFSNANIATVKRGGGLTGVWFDGVEAYSFLDPEKNYTVGYPPHGGENGRSPRNYATNWKSWGFQHPLPTNAKVCFESTFPISNQVIGVGTSSMVWSSNAHAAGQPFWGVLGVGGAAYSVGTVVDTYAGGPGTRLTFAIDTGTGEMWMAYDGIWQNSGDPVAGTGAVITSISNLTDLYIAGSYYTAAQTISIEQNTNLLKHRPSGFRGCYVEPGTPSFENVLAIAGGGGAGGYYSTYYYAPGGPGNGSAGGGYYVNGMWGYSQLSSLWGSGGGGWLGGSRVSGEASGAGGSGKVCSLATSSSIEASTMPTTDPPQTGDSDYASPAGKAVTVTVGNPGRAVLNFT